MSDEGKLMRGLKWYQFRDKNGNYPEGITKTEKQVDLNFYLDFIKDKEENQVNEILKKLSIMARTSKKGIPEYKKLLEDLKKVGNKSAKVK